MHWLPNTGFDYLKYNTHSSSCIVYKIDRQIIGRDSLIETIAGSIETFSRYSPYTEKFTKFYI